MLGPWTNIAAFSTVCGVGIGVGIAGSCKPTCLLVSLVPTKGPTHAWTRQKHARQASAFPRSKVEQRAVGVGIVVGDGTGVGLGVGVGDGLHSAQSHKVRAAETMFGQELGKRKGSMQGCVKRRGCLGVEAGVGDGVGLAGGEGEVVVEGDFVGLGDGECVGLCNRPQSQGSSAGDSCHCGYQ